MNKTLILSIIIVATFGVIGYFLWPKAGSLERGLFAYHLKSIASKRIAQGRYGRHALVLDGHNTTAIVISNLQGELESFNRIIADLQQKDFLSTDLKIKDPRTILVFNGNSIGEGQDFEVLEKIVELVFRNIHVFYIRGEQENKEAWLTKTLGKQLKKMFPRDFAHFRTNIREFFNSRPLGVYLTTSEAQTIRISSGDDEEFKHIACESVTGQSLVKAICMLDALCSFDEGKLLATVVADQKGIAWDSMQGLQVTGKPPVWHIVSSPTLALKETERYKNCAYAVIRTTDSLEKATITLYYQQQTVPKPFITGTTSYLTTGKPVTP